MTDEYRLTERETFSFIHTETIRFSDQDPQKHINNVAFSAFCEGGRVAWMDRFVTPLRSPTEGMVSARVTIDFRHEMHYPGTVEVCTKLLAIGRSSLTLGQGLFQDGRCTATSTATLVQFDLEQRRSKPFSPTVVAVLQALLETGAIQPPAQP